MYHFVLGTIAEVCSWPTLSSASGPVRVEVNWLYPKHFALWKGYRGGMCCLLGSLLAWASTVHLWYSSSCLIVPVEYPTAVWFHFFSFFQSCLGSVDPENSDDHCSASLTVMSLLSDLPMIFTCGCNQLEAMGLWLHWSRPDVDRTSLTLEIFTTWRPSPFFQGHSFTFL